MYCLFCVVLSIVCVYVCTVLLPPGGYPIAVKHIYYPITVFCIVCVYMCTVLLPPGGYPVAVKHISYPIIVVCIFVCICVLSPSRCIVLEAISFSGTRNKSHWVPQQLIFNSYLRA